MLRYCCFAKKDNPVSIAPISDIKKVLVICGLCKNGKSVLTLVCNHNVCIKCYSKYKYCTQCDKPGCWE